MSTASSTKHTSSIKIYFTTVVRAAPQEQGGEIVRVDWQSKTVEARQSIYPTNPDITDPNPRGNTRGGRGIEFVEDEVIVASYHTLKIYDRQLLHRRDISNPLLVGLHETFSNGDGRVWAASTAIDAVLGINVRENNIFQQYWPRELPSFQQELGLTPLEIDKQADNRLRFLEKRHITHPSHLHLNAIALFGGKLFGLFNSFSVIANLDDGEIVIRDKSLRHPHNLHIEDDGTAIVNNTFGRAIHIYNLHTKELVRKIDLTRFALVRRLLIRDQLNYLARGFLKKFFAPQINAPRPAYLRGLDKFGDSLYVGISPATILCIDIKRGELVDYFSYSADVNACIHGLKVVAE